MDQCGVAGWVGSIPVAIQCWYTYMNQADESSQLELECLDSDSQNPQVAECSRENSGHWGVVEGVDHVGCQGNDGIDHEWDRHTIRSRPHLHRVTIGYLCIK